ncbi:MAG: maleylacetoacetate isomerase [Cellvibrionaceae bacterium]
MKLYTFFRSSAAYRVRIALNIKGLDYEAVPINLVENDGEQHKDSFHEINPQELIPALVEDGESYTQSLAIIEYLEEQHPEIPLMPESPRDRALVRAMALTIACDIHPLNNLRVLNYLKDELEQDEKAINKWYTHWITLSFKSLEEQVNIHGGDYCFGNTITVADVFLIPQIANAKRFKIDLTPFPKLSAIDNALSEHPAFQAAAPDNQPDAPE